MNVQSVLALQSWQPPGAPQPPPPPPPPLMPERKAQRPEPKGPLSTHPLRAAVMDRLLRDMTALHARLSQTLGNVDRTRVINLSLVLSESTLTQELWAGPRSSPEARARLVHTLGLPPETDNGALVRTLMDQVHRAFVDFHASRPGAESRQRYLELLQLYEMRGVLLVLPGYDSGPMLGELARLEVTATPEFSRSLLWDPRVLPVGPGPEDKDVPLLVNGVSPPQLGMVAAQLRILNPLLTNKQMRSLLAITLIDTKSASRKNLGRSEVEKMHELARQLLRLQAVEHLVP